jgi:FixJ family two-component response regulator
MLKPRILIGVVDDEEPVRKALARLFGSEGFEVNAFASGREFLHSLTTRCPDCVVLDLHLPELSGMEVQAQLEQEHFHVPVIMITGRDEPGVAERARAAGAAAYLTKPLEKRDLLEAIAAATSNHFIAERAKAATPRPSPRLLAQEP